MFARVSRFQGTPEDAAESASGIGEVVEKAEALAGFAGMIYLIDRSSGRTMAVTLWESEEAMRASEEAADRIRADEAQKSGASVVAVERYEVVTADVR
jgi:heme-degrading monooxygenase HmoA